MKETQKLSKDSREQLLCSCGGFSTGMVRNSACLFPKEAEHIHFQVWSRTDMCQRAPCLFPWDCRAGSCSERMGKRKQWAADTLQTIYVFIQTVPPSRPCFMCFSLEWKVSLVSCFHHNTSNRSLWRSQEYKHSFLYLHKIWALRSQVPQHLLSTVTSVCGARWGQRSWLLDSLYLNLVYLNTPPLIQWQKIVLAADMSLNLKSEYGLYIVKTPTEWPVHSGILETSYLDRW